MIDKQLTQLLEEACVYETGEDMCALQRLASFMGYESFNYPSYREAAINAGFTISEYYGIMDGWDEIASGTGDSFHNDAESEREYQNGRVLAKRLAKRHRLGTISVE